MAKKSKRIRELRAFTIEPELSAKLDRVSHALNVNFSEAVNIILAAFDEPEQLPEPAERKVEWKKPIFPDREEQRREFTERYRRGEQKRTQAAAN